MPSPSATPPQVARMSVSASGVAGTAPVNRPEKSAGANTKPSPKSANATPFSIRKRAVQRLPWL
jgi:hypothetical protein